MGVSVRPATVEDLLAMQRCNLLCLPENYQLKVSGPVVSPARTRSSTCHATLLHAWDYKPCDGACNAIAADAAASPCAVLLLPHPVVAAAAASGAG